MGNGSAKAKPEVVKQEPTSTTKKTDEKPPKVADEKPKPTHNPTKPSNDKSSDSSHTPQRSSEPKQKKEDAATKKEEQLNKKLEKFFDDYKDPESTADDQFIGPDGVVRLLEDVNIDPEDPTVLVFAYHLQAKVACTFSKQEWIVGCKKLGVENVEQLKTKWATFQGELSASTHLKDVYRFTFHYIKEDPGHKTINLEITKAYLKLLLHDKPHIAKFCEFLDQQTEYRGMNLDQWMVLYDFISTVSDDLSNYDENAAWPVILDSFVTWKRKQNSGAAQNPSDA